MHKEIDPKISLQKFFKCLLKAESTLDSRIAYDTYRKLAVIIAQQDHQLDEWVTTNHVAIPIVSLNEFSHYQLRTVS